MKKEILFAILGFFAFLLFGYLALAISDSSDDIKVDGRDALKIASAHFGYWLWIILAIIASAAIIIYGIKKDWYGPKIVIAGLFCGLIIAFALFTYPVNIKTDPKSAGITTPEIEYLKTKGLK